MNQFYVYILASRRDGALYVGVTNDLVRRVYEHRQKAIPGHTKRYQIERLVYFESTILRRWRFNARRT
jgi:putative endonuclease